MKRTPITVITLMLFTLLQSSSSQAVMLARGNGHAWGQEPEASTWGLAALHPKYTLLKVSCFLLLPLCLLNKEQTEGESYFDESLLMDEYGYSEEEAAQLADEQISLLKKMNSKKLKLVIEDSDTAQTIQTQIKDVYPQASSFFLRNYVELLGFDEQ